MAIEKPSLPKGTRDFSPQVMLRRNYIFGIIKNVFRKFGFLPLETPSMEQLSVLTGKYGDEGDQLIFKILNSGDFLKDVQPADLEKGYKATTPKVAEKALRYDLTIPFARYVVMNKNELTFPFKRYQIQPVWRADRPQRGRYREFYQCDADVVGTDSLICEAEIVLMIKEVLHNLGINAFSIKINNRKILSGIAGLINAEDSLTDLCVAIDKLDKIGWEGVEKELEQRGFSSAQIASLKVVFSAGSGSVKVLETLKEQFTLNKNELGLKGIAELQEVFRLLNSFEDDGTNLEVDLTLARGLSYYTGAIFEVKVNNVNMGSISGGGRYDDLTGVFGVPGLSGVGFSFGVDRIYDVMDELGLFENLPTDNVQVMIANFGNETLAYSLSLLNQLRSLDIRAEIYPEPAKMKKQFSYADAKGINYVIIAGDTEMAADHFTLKNLKTGEQLSYSLTELKKLSFA